MRNSFRCLTIMAAIAVVVIATTGFAGGSDGPQVVHPTKVLHPDHFGVTPPLATVAPLPPKKGVANHEIPNHEVTRLPVLPKATAPDEPKGEARRATVGNRLSPAPTVAFDGLNSDTNASVVGFRVMPPDTEGAVGMSYYIQWINLVWAIYNKSDGSIAAGPFPGNQVWATALPGTDCASSNDGDPIVLYDHGAQRWFMAQFMASSPYAMCLAVSQTSDPTGAWYAWQYEYGTQFPDYPKFGVWPDGYYMTVNEFGSGDPATTVFDRTAMLAGDASPAAQYFAISGVQPAFPQPTNWDGGDAPPAGEPNYNIAFYDDAWGNPVDMLQMCAFHVDWTTPANSTFTCPSGAGDPGYIDLTAAGLSFDSNLCGYSRDCIPQMGSTQKLDTLSDRLMFPANYRNLMATKGYEVMVVTHSVDVDGSDHAGVRWYELHNTGSGWFIYDGGTFAPDSDNRWMGSATVDAEGDIGIMYTISSSTTYPSVGFAGRLATDPAGSMQSETVLVSGAGTQEGGNRWGDYAAMHTDPDGCTMWGTAEYVNAGGNFNWDTYIGAFSMPGCTPSGFGTVSGTVTNSATGDPIEGAQVQIGGYTTFTQADGSYAMNVPADTYDITATAFGFAPQTVTGIVVDDGGSVVQDFALDPVGTADFDGYVTDAGHGWPLYAKVELAVNGSPVATVYTNPFNGYYEVPDMPQGFSFDFTVTPVETGFIPATRTVVLPPGGDTESFVIEPDPVQNCIAPGWTLATGGLSENFDGSFPPAGWTVTDAMGSGLVWSNVAASGESGNWAGTGDAASASSDAFGSAPYDTYLTSPVVDLTGVGTVVVEARVNFQNFAGYDYFQIDVSADGGSTWTNVLSWNEDHGGFRSPDSGEDVSIDVSSEVAGSANAMVRFRYYDPVSHWNWYAQVDDVFFGAKGCAPKPGAMMAGFVTDANTTMGINGASIADDQGNATSSFATPDDPAIGDGFYEFFVDLPTGNGPSTRTFTVGASGYAEQQVQTNPSPEAVNQLDFALEAGWLEVTPTHMEARLYSGETENQVLDIINHGGVDANVSLLAFETAGWVPNSPMDQIPAPNVPAAHLNDRTAQAANVPEHEPGAPLAAGDVIASWPTGLTYGWGLGVNKFADNLWVGNIGAGGGDDLDYEYTRAGSQTGTTYDTSSWMGSFAGDMAFDSLNGTMWQLAVGGDNCIHEWDPGTQTTTGNVICWGATTSERGLAYDPISDTFFVGGWNTNAITRFDRTGTVLQTANVGIGISGLAYNPGTGHLFVQENSPTDTITVLDVNDNYNVVGSFTVSGMGSYGGAGLSFTCDGHLWLINQQTQTVFEVDSGESGACISSSLPWFTTTPDSGVVPANEGDLPIDGQFIADGAPHWGLVQGRVMILHDTPYQVDDVTLCLTKAFNDMPVDGNGDPTDWTDPYVHSVAGARITLGCGGGNFCPNDIIPRGVVARWLILAEHGPDYSPPVCTGIFSDVICELTPNADYIEALFNEGISAGCFYNPGTGERRFCPDQAFNRQEMAVQILRTKGMFDQPPYEGIFSDMPVCDPDPAVFCWSRWAEEFFRQGITAGCFYNPYTGERKYCPTMEVSRSHMAVFTQRAFDLPMCDSGDVAPQH
ncbi:MAG: carboxypeptidase regulatory-like domain-containing protein [Acidobacteria bacterium]|nr:carboxypeptidase regulatory-like domain-containing protein [Acidobacteriota bacterium]